MGNFVIITAGGTGTRMKSEIPKQFLFLKGIPILMQTIKRFYDFDNSLKIILTLPELFISQWNILCEEHNFNIIHEIIPGGETRFHSVKNATNGIHKADLVAIHDGVRPLVSRKTIRSAFELASKEGNAVASSDINFSIRKFEKNVSFSVNRNNFKEIQTPQIFRFDVLKRAYNIDYSDDFTDDATVVEKSGIRIHLSEGNIENIKITTEYDLRIAEVLWDTVF